MKKLLTLLPALLALTAHGQIIGKSVPEYTTKLGTTFHKGDTLTLGLGTDVAGRFKYIVVPPNALLGSHYDSPLDRNFANRSVVIKDLRLQNRSRVVSERTVAVIKTGGINAAADLESAEEAGEIKTAHNLKPMPPAAAAAPPTGVADELLKLKKLLDAGVITQAEFDSQKAKLLGK